MFGLGIWELVVILLIVLVVFGAKRLPEIGASLGQGIREFKDSVSELEEETSREIPSGGEDRPREPGQGDGGGRRSGGEPRSGGAPGSGGGAGG